MFTLKMLFISFRIWHLGTANWAGVDQGFLGRGLLICSLTFLQFGLFFGVLFLALNLLLPPCHDEAMCVDIHVQVARGTSLYGGMKWITAPGVQLKTRWSNFTVRMYIN